jgi:hypothetical protein
MAYDDTLSTTLLFDPSGPLVKYKRDAFGEWLSIDDLNPEKHIHFRLTPWQLLRFGFKCIWAAIVP